MSATYTINILNKSGVNQQYLLFNQPPLPTPSTGQAFSNVWIKTTGTPSPNGQQNLTITQENYAMCGTLPAPLATGVVVKETDYAPVNLAGSSPGTAPTIAITAGSPGFVAPFGTTSAPNSFGINTASWNNDQFKNAFWFGYGKLNAQGNIVPVASYPALPNQQYSLQPNVIFYVGTGSYQAGEAVNLTEIGPISTINFTQALPGQTIATITQDSSFNYSAPVFSYPPTKDGKQRLPIPV